MHLPAGCPLCHLKLLSLTQLRRHLAKHHEELSLFAIPSHIKEDDHDVEEEKENEGSLSSIAASDRPRSSTHAQPLEVFEDHGEFGHLKLSELGPKIEDWRLIDYAKKAEDAASGLHTLLDKIPRYRSDITGDMAELFAISNALHVFHEHHRTRRPHGESLKDLELCLLSLDYTLTDISNLFGEIKGSSRIASINPLRTPPYEILWEDSLADMKAQGMSLPTRLELFKGFLQDIDDSLRG